MTSTTASTAAAGTTSAPQATASIQPQGSEMLSSSTFHQSYHEVGARHVVESDVLEQLKGNMAQLEDLHNRMQFMMKELGYLLKKSF